LSFWLTDKDAQLDDRRRYVVAPKRVIWSDPGTGKIEGVQALLEDNSSGCKISLDGKRTPAIVLDFGQELSGGICVEIADPPPPAVVKVRIRFGESVSEVMGQPDTDHVIHDIVLDLPSMGKHEFGNTGFRFIGIDFLESNDEITVQSINAIAIERPLQYKGQFECSDEVLNQVWLTGARTVHLCCQEHILDGIKRDRLLWVGDIHPQVNVISSVFGDIDIVKKSLNFASAQTYSTGWMNDHSAYSIWWLITVWDWYMCANNLDWLTGQHLAVVKIVEHLIKHIDESGKEELTGHRFLDWQVGHNEEIITEGLQALTVLGFEAAISILKELKDHLIFDKAKQTLELLKKVPLKPVESKQVNALRVMAGLVDAKEANEKSLAVDPCGQISTWYAYYVLQARAMADDHIGCLDFIRKYWGAMLELGATTFWEHFNIKWAEKAGRIDEIVPEGKLDVHAECGDHCYKGFRHSLCHGWAAGPTAWLSRYILGITPVAPGFRKVKIVPHLADLDYAKGVFPTPQGLIKVKHTKTSGGKIATEYEVPENIEVVNSSELK